MLGWLSRASTRALAPEPLAADRVEECEVEQLDRDGALVAAVAPPGQPHRTHSALAERPLERVGAQPLAGEPGSHPVCR